MKFSTLLHYLTFVPFDTQTVQGQQQERYRRAAWSVIADIVSKASGMAVMVMSVTLTLPYLGEERFGVWMTIASFAGMLTFLDLGIGNALTNHIAKAVTHDRHETLSSAISGGLGLMLLVGVVMALILIVIASQLPWQSLIKVKDTVLYDEIRIACMWFAGLFGLNLFTSSIMRVFSGLQQAYYGHIAASVGSWLALVALWWLTQKHAGISILLIVSLGAQSLSGLFLLGLLIQKKLLLARGIFRAIGREYKVLFHSGSLFFILQIGCMIGWGADSLIISATLGASQVAVYNVTQRLFQFVSQPLAMMNAPLWAAYADAHARHDSEFIKKTLKRSLFLTLGSAILGAIILLSIGQQVIEIWTKGSIFSPLLFIAVMGVWTIIDSVGNSFAMLMNGCHIVKPQMMSVLIFCMLTIPIKFLFVYEYGLVGIIVATILVYIISVPIFYAIFFRAVILDTIRQPN